MGCQELEAKIESLSKQCVQPNMNMLMEWDLSSIDVSQYERGLKKISRKFNLPGFDVQAWFSFFPKGSDSSPPNKAAFYVFASDEICISCTVSLGGMEGKLKRQTVNINGRGWPALFDQSAEYAQARIAFRSISKTDSRLTFIFSSQPE